ncbi:hypothetical protein EGW08_006444 [Elysia chlorotica]|uniref:Uncharacterized protein n=1 Tax=Elysia chlorotica TaxID=188477 RepID=A0A433TW94_ELYCH|nr:hypothetical protein EGW08_006444 [Elysia chlorotica]
MNDISYDPFGRITEDVSEEVRDGAFGQTILYCKRGCCGDNRAPECCAPEDDVGQKTFETYKLITVIAAGVVGLAIIAVIVVAIVKWQLKKRRLIRDIQALNRMNRMTDLKTKVKGIGDDGEDKKRKKKKSKRAAVVHVKAAPPEVDPIPPPASYASLNPSTMISIDPPARSEDSVGKPVFLPAQPPSRSIPAPMATAPPQPDPYSYKFENFETSAPAATGLNRFQKLPGLRPGPVAAGVNPLTVPSVSNAFSTPLAESPAMFSGLSVNQSTSPPDHASFAKNSASSDSSRSDIPWDDADLLLYFSNPPRS